MSAGKAVDLASENSFPASDPPGWVPVRAGAPEAAGDAHVVEDQSASMAALGDPRTHGLTADVVRIDTHGAVVFLAGENVYKMKRAVRFPFMDYSTLEKRRAACEAEVAVNAAFAPDLYLGTLPLTASEDGLKLGGSGPAVEWLVHMRRFDERQTLDHVAAAGALSPELITRLARAVLASHERAPVCSGEAATASLARYLDQNHRAFAESPELFAPARVDALSSRSRRELARLSGLLHARGQAGFVRRCHGDLHLRNIVLRDGEPTLFDAIEFDAAVATGDVLYDLAFLLMDLWGRGLRREANLVLNRYFWEAGEALLGGLAALPLLLSIRAAIRAKVAAASLIHQSGENRAAAIDEARRYFEMTEEFLAPWPPCLIGIGGLSGAGKSTLAARLACRTGRPPGALIVRSDVVRKRLAGVEETQRLPAESYAPAVTETVYAILRRDAAAALSAGYSVIVDAVHARQGEREALEALAETSSVPFRGFWLEAPERTLLQRVAARTADASDATAAVVKEQSRLDAGEVTWTRLSSSDGIDRALDTALKTIPKTRSSQQTPRLRSTEAVR